MNIKIKTYPTADHDTLTFDFKNVRRVINKKDYQCYECEFREPLFMREVEQRFQIIVDWRGGTIIELAYDTKNTYEPLYDDMFAFDPENMQFYAEC